MGLKSTVTDINEIAEPLREHYKEIDGKFVLQAEGLVGADKLDEFRTNNKKLNDQLKKMQEQWGDYDPEEVKAALDIAKKSEEKKLLDDGEIDKLLEKRMAPVIKEKDTKLAALQAEFEKSQATNRHLLIDTEAQRVGAELGVAPSAFEDFTRRMRDTFEVKDGKAVRIDAEGNTMFTGAGTPQTIKDFGLELKEKAGHLFTPSGGGGGRAGSGAPGAGDNRPKSAREKIAAGLEKRRAAG